MADALTQIIAISQRLEQLLKNKYGAEGDGLISEYKSIKDKLPALVVRTIDKQIYELADMRNKATHENVVLAEQYLESAKRAYKIIYGALTSPYTAPKTNEEQFLHMEAALERLLVQRFDASGPTLHAKYSAAERRLDSQTKDQVGKRVRFIATIGNNVVRKGKKVDDKTIKSVAAAYDVATEILSKATVLPWTPKPSRFKSGFKSKPKKNFASSSGFKSFPGSIRSGKSYQSSSRASAPRQQTFAYRPRSTRRADDANPTYALLVYVIGGLVVVVVLLVFFMMLASLKKDEPQQADPYLIQEAQAPADLQGAAEKYLGNLDKVEVQTPADPQATPSP